MPLIQSRWMGRPMNHCHGVFSYACCFVFSIYFTLSPKCGIYIFLYRCLVIRTWNEYIGFNYSTYHHLHSTFLFLLAVMEMWLSCHHHNRWFHSNKIPSWISNGMLKLSQYPWITVLCNRNPPKNIKLNMNGWVTQLHIHHESSSHSSIVQKSSASSAVSGLKRKEMQIYWSMRNIHDSLTILELWLVTIFWLCGLWILLTTPSMVNNGHLKF